MLRRGSYIRATRQSTPNLQPFRKWMKSESNPFAPYYIKSYFVLAFFGTAVFMTSSLTMLMEGGMKVNEEERKQRKHADPRRPRWPVLHQRLMEIREGDGALGGLSALWASVQYYYADDWLLPLEMAMILRIRRNELQPLAGVLDAERLRQEVLFQLLNIKYDRVREVLKIETELQNIIGDGIEDLEGLFFSSQEGHRLRKPVATETMD